MPGEFAFVGWPSYRGQATLAKLQGSGNVGQAAAAGRMQVPQNIA
jgi:hypothetical protein